MLKKKSDTMVTYQLTLYKKFFCEKHGLDPKDVETYFGLLKRTAKQDNVEIFRVTSGARKTTNALKVLTNACNLINKGIKIKDNKLIILINTYKIKKKINMFVRISFVIIISSFHIIHM